MRSDRVPENYGLRFVTLHRTFKTTHKKKKCKKGKWLSEEALQIGEKREAKHREEKERYTHLNSEFQRIARRDKKAFLSDQCKKNRRKQWNGKD